jgi:hypothetical protein
MWQALTRAGKRIWPAGFRIIVRSLVGGVANARPTRVWYSLVGAVILTGNAPDSGAHDWIVKESCNAL